MTNQAAKAAGQRQRLRWLRMQSLAALALAAVLLAYDPVAAYSSLFGSLAVYVPTALFTFLVGRKVGQSSAVFLRAAVIGEVTKLMLMALLCMAVFVWVRPLEAGWFFAGMFAVLITGWFGLIFTK